VSDQPVWEGETLALLAARQQVIGAVLGLLSAQNGMSLTKGILPKLAGTADAAEALDDAVSGAAVAVAAFREKKEAIDAWVGGRIQREIARHD
jgi:hypothetical protein